MVNLHASPCQDELVHKVDCARIKDSMPKRDQRAVCEETILRSVLAFKILTRNYLCSVVVEIAPKKKNLENNDDDVF